TATAYRKCRSSIAGDTPCVSARRANPAPVLIFRTTQAASQRVLQIMTTDEIQQSVQAPCDRGSRRAPIQGATKMPMKGTCTLLGAVLLLVAGHSANVVAQWPKY